MTVGHELSGLVGRCSSRGCGVRDLTARWCRGEDDAGEPKQGQSQEQHPCHDMECSRHESSLLSSYTGLCSGIIIALRTDDVNILPLVWTGAK